jgi:hypothetical protein
MRALVYPNPGMPPWTTRSRLLLGHMGMVAVMPPSTTNALPVT